MNYTQEVFSMRIIVGQAERLRDVMKKAEEKLQNLWNTS